MKILGVIPARLSSTRFPNKPLADINGKSLVQRVWEQAKKSKRVSHLVIATEDQEILDCARAFSANAILTSSSNRTGSDRVAETLALHEKNGQKFDLVANIQGDMPFINPEVIDGTIEALLGDRAEDFGMSTVATPIFDVDEYERPSCVKVAMGNDGRALYFSRAPIPFWRDKEDMPSQGNQVLAHRHLGLYVFKPETLRTMSQFPEAECEKMEKLEQLRVLSAGISIKVFVASREMVSGQIEVDTPADLEKAIEIARHLSP